MKAVMPVALPEVLHLRRQTGADRFDEMWEGVLHMAPAPNRQHQLIARELVRFLADVWEPRAGGLALGQVNVSTPDRWPDDYRVPDVAVVTRDARTGGEVRFEQPAVAFEVRSPDDETYDKLGFYASVGLQSLVVIDRDTRAVQVFRAARDGMVAAAPGADGWTVIHPIGVEIRSDDGQSGPTLRLRLRGEPATERTI
jgi:Uma2 family endonuclease